MPVENRKRVEKMVDEGVEAFRQAGGPEAVTEALAAPKRTKASYVGAPACFLLEQACQDLFRAFDARCYLVGSALERPDWRDIDVRMILSDEEFLALFPGCTRGTSGRPHNWEFDPRWIIMTTSIAAHLSRVTGLPIDFQFQPRTHANDAHKGPRHALGLIFAKND